MASKLGSFRYSFKEKRDREKLLVSKGGGGYSYSSLGLGLGIPLLEDPPEPRNCLGDKIREWGKGFGEFVRKAVEMGKTDPRKAIFSAKMGLALTLLSFLMFLDKPFEDIGRYSVWALLTVVVVFEFSIGATFSKGFNRGLGTLSAGGLALGIAMLSTFAGDWEELVIIISIFIIGFTATYLKLYPTLKDYEYGIRVFLLTYCFLMVNGYRTREFVDTAFTRFILIALGAAVALLINTCIYPIWAGEDLHNLVVKNFVNVATSLEGVVNGYLSCIEYKRVPSKILTFQASDDPLYSGYRSAVDSASKEDTLVGFAIWEPPHGPYRIFNYPWKSYTKVSGALRHCAFTVMAMHGCVLSEIQAPAELREIFRSELQKVGNEGSKVLRVLGNKLKAMEKIGPAEDLLYHIDEAAEALQKKIDRKSYLLVNSESWEIGNPQKHPEQTQDLLTTEFENSLPVVKSLSDLEALHNFPSFDGQTNHWTHRKQASLPPSLLSFGNGNKEQHEDESKTYESASALSLATFASLQIEFVARLQNLVDSFKDLSEKANFKEPINHQAPEVRMTA